MLVKDLNKLYPVALMELCHKTVMFVDDRKLKIDAGANGAVPGIFVAHLAFDIIDAGLLPYALVAITL